jgi:DNA-binding PucR family transcriptional regulator
MSVLPGASLTRIVEDLGDTILEVVAAGSAAHNHVGAVVIYDSRHVPPPPRRAVVLGVGVNDSEEIQELLITLGRQEAAALVVRGPVERDTATLRAVRESGVALLAMTQGASWLQLADVIRTVLASTEIGDEGPSTLRGLPAGDLFSLANAIAELIDAPITIEDRKFHVLAFSSGQDHADTARIQTILSRQVPGVYIREDEDRGIIQALYGTDEPMYFEPSLVTENELPRVAIAVHAGDEILGSIWAAVGSPLTPERLGALSDAAKLVALHLLRRRAGTDVDRRLRSDLVATALEGGPASPQAMGRLGLSGKRVAVIALGVLDESPRDSDPSRRAAEQRLADALAMHLSAVAPRSEVALLDGVAYGLILMAGNVVKDLERVKQIAANFLRRTGSRTPAVIGIGPVVREDSQLSPSRARADRALRVLRARANPGSVATSEEVHIEALVLELQDLTTARDDPVSAPIKKLFEYDARRDSNLVNTLMGWLDAFGDTHVAAANAGVHPNTFRYRLKRVAEVGDIDLHNPDDRFAMMLQLRLLPKPTHQ